MFGFFLFGKRGSQEEHDGSSSNNKKQKTEAPPITPPKDATASATQPPGARAPTDRSASLLAELVHESLWTENLEPYLKPRDCIRLAGTNTTLRDIHTRDAYWKPLVQAVDGGRYHQAIQRTGALDFYEHSLMRAYAAVTSWYCHGCVKVFVKVDVLHLKPWCVDCFNEWAATGLMDLERAQFIYMLSKEDTARVPRVDVIDSRYNYKIATAVTREHIVSVATAKYGSLEGLRAAKVEAQRLSQYEWDLKYGIYEAKKEAALARGFPRPPPPCMPRILHMPLDPKPEETGIFGWNASSKCAAAVLYTPGAPAN